MTCTDAYSEMLIADPADLRAAGGTELATHLAECAPCRARATSMAADMETLGVLVERRRVATRRRWTTLRVACLATVPVAAGVVVAIVLRDRQSMLPSPAVVAARAARLPVARNVSLDVAAGQQATVLKTADPKVTVIWLTPGVGQ